MAADHDILEEIAQRVRDARSTRTPLQIRGGGSKAFYGRPVQGPWLEMASWSGIEAYEPSELVVTVRAGTPLSDLERILAAEGQMLAFEPPHFDDRATVGGAVACGLSGPRRPYAGAVRDFVLGTRIINGKGEVLRFGGQVMKNVAGFDVSRLMVGAMGTLGVLLEVSFKVLPQPRRELTLKRPMAMAEAIELMNRWAGRPLPLSAAAHDGSDLYCRLSGPEAAVSSAQEQIGGEVLDDASGFWSGLREHRLTFFSDERPLWRLSLPPAAAMPSVPGEWFVDWGGAQRWLHTRAAAQEVRSAAVELGGHAVLFRGGPAAEEPFAPLSGPLQRLHRGLKNAFDPDGILNPGRLYAGF